MNRLLLTHRIAEMHRDDMLRAADMARLVRSARTASPSRGIDVRAILWRLRRIPRSAFRARERAA